MDTNFLIQITNNLYRLTLFFPNKEPLKYKMREKASDILVNGNNGKKYDIINTLLEDLETLNLFFEVAKNQDWVNVSDIDIVQAGYLRFKKELKEWKELNGISGKNEVFIEQGQTPPAWSVPAQIDKTISERQKKILEFIEEQKGNSIQVHQVQELFPKLTKRTLRRDFEHLLSQGLVQRIGERNKISYQLVRT